MEVIRAMNYRMSCVVIARHTSAFLLGMEVVVSVLCIVTRATTISLIIGRWAKGTESSCTSGILCSLMGAGTRLIDQATRAKDLSA